MIIHVPVSLVGSPGWYYVLGTNIMPTQIATNQGKIQSKKGNYVCICVTLLWPCPPPPRPIPIPLVFTDDGLLPLWKLFVKVMLNTRFMSWNGALTNLFESPCDKLVITLTHDAYEKYNCRALRALEVIFPVIITWSCYKYHIGGHNLCHFTWN